MDKWVNIIRRRYLEYIANCTVIELALSDMVNELKQPPINLNASFEKVTGFEIAWKFSIGSKSILLPYKEISGAYNLQKMKDFDISPEEFIIRYFLEKFKW